ncbi:MAG: hypothetical protein ACLRZ9_05285 [Eubacterium sp.]
MKTNAKKVVALILTIAMVFTGIQMNSYKAKAEETDSIVISTAEELAKIGVDADYPMDGKYRLEEDLADVQTTIGDLSTPFTGEFDGDGHSVTLNIVTEENYKGLFGYINGATIKNIVVKGKINTQYGWAAGIAAKTVNSIITNCGSEVDIHSDGSNSTCFGGITGYAESSTISNCYNAGSIDGKIKNAAGIAGQTKTIATIENCYNTGAITTTATSSPRVAGIVGHGLLTSGNQGKITNCYNAGTITGTSQTGTFMGYIYTGYLVTNCYYLEGTHDNVVGFNYQADIEDIKSVTTDELKGLTETLGEAFVISGDLNNGYPVLTWQMPNTDAEDTATLEALVSELPTGVISPKYNTDKNINTYISNIIEGKEQYKDKGITVSVKTVENRLGDTDTFIEEDGTINYFYRNLFETAPYRYFGQADITFNLKLNNVSVEYSPRCVNIYWNLDSVKTDLQTVAEEYNVETILGENPSVNEVTKSLSLPNYPIVNHNGEDTTVKWVSVKYTSSNPKVIKIDDSAQWDSDYNNMYYNAEVMRKEEDTQVTITAEFIFERYTMNSGEDTITETITRDIPVTVSASNEEEEAIKSLQEKVNSYADKLTDFNNGEALDFSNVKNDIQLVIPKELGLDGKEYEFKVESSDSSVMEIYGYRTYTYRPLPGQEAKKVTLTVTITNKANANITCSTDIEMTVVPLTEQEITDAVNFMEDAKANLFEFIKSENTDTQSITSDMSTFYGIYQDEEGRVYATTYVDKPNNNGILVKIVNPDEPVPDYKRYWISSNNDVIDDQTLRVTVPKYNTKVTVGTVLSHEIYENYAKRYADDPVYGEIFNKLTNQEVSVDVIVKGTDGEEPATNVEIPTTNGNVETTTTGNNELSKTEKNKIVKKLKVKKFKTKKKKKSIKITWKKNKYADGYKIVYAANKKLKKSRKVFVKSGKKKSRTIKKLKQKKYYYVKMKAYKIVNGKRVYGKWTKIKKVKTK